MPHWPASAESRRPGQRPQQPPQRAQHHARAARSRVRVREACGTAVHCMRSAGEAPTCAVPLIVDMWALCAASWRPRTAAAAGRAVAVLSAPQPGVVGSSAAAPPAAPPPAPLGGAASGIGAAACALPVSRPAAHAAACCSWRACMRSRMSAIVCARPRQLGGVASLASSLAAVASWPTSRLSMASMRSRCMVAWAACARRTHAQQCSSR